MTTDDDLTDELAIVTEALTPSKRARDEAARAPEGFDPAAMFLLRLGWYNLFEPVGQTTTFMFRCKGCGTVVPGRERERHFRWHGRQVARGLAKQPASLYRDTTASGKTPGTSTHTHEGDITMAKATTTDSKPRVLKTKVARDAAIDVLTKAAAPLTMEQITDQVMKRKAVIDAGVPKGTVSAQVNFELAESEPRIYRVSRGVYALKGVKAEVPAVKGKDVTPDPKPAPKRSRAKKAEKTEAETVTVAVPAEESAPVEA